MTKENIAQRPNLSASAADEKDLSDLIIIHNHNKNSLPFAHQNQTQHIFDAPPATPESSSVVGTHVAVPQNNTTSSSAVSSLPHDPPLISSGPPHHHRKLRHKGKSFSSDLDREAAWERKKELFFHDEQEEEFCHPDEQNVAHLAYEDFYGDLCEDQFEVESPSNSDDDGHDVGKSKQEHIKYDEHNMDVIGGHSDDTVVEHLDVAQKHSKGGHSYDKLFRSPMKPRPRRTRSLTDEDMEELKGSMDLGFDFNYVNESSNLTATLPALELYYAINRNFADAQIRSSPDANVLVRTNSGDSTSSTLSHQTWHISSPGDNPSQVKTRLRHWAQAVAFSVKQGY